MKKLILFLALTITVVFSFSQTNVYHPFPNTNAFWGDKGWNIFNWMICGNTRYGFMGDTMINSQNYKKVYSLFDSTLTNPHSTYFAAIREQNKKVYVVIGTFPEEVLYDFNLVAGDTITYNYSIVFNTATTFSRVVTKIDSALLLNGKYRKRWIFGQGTNGVIPDTVIEGIGSIYNRGLFNPLVNNMLTNGDEWRFECFKQNDTVLYLRNPDCNECFCQLLTSIKTTIEPEQSNIFPNPFTSQTTIQTGKDLNDATLTIYNSFGQEVKLIKNIKGQSVTLKRDDLSSGLYILQIIQDNKIFTTDKLIIIVN